MKYNASLDILAKIITLVTILLFIWLGYVSIMKIAASPGNTRQVIAHSVLIAFYVAVVAGCYLYAPGSYETTSDRLMISRPVRTIIIDRKDIIEARALDPKELTGLVRTFGVGGLFGYYGRYYNSTIGAMVFFTTQRKNRILIRTRQGVNFVLSPDDLSLAKDIVGM